MESVSQQSTFEKIRTSLNLTMEELVYKTTWPTWDELQSSAIVTLVASLLIALLVFLMDTVFDNLFKIVYSAFR